MGNLSLNNSLSGVLGSQQALDVISQNVSNAEDEDYSRQRAILKSNKPLFQDGKFFGTGVNVEEVVRRRDSLLEDRLNSEQQNLSRFDELSNVYQQIETFLNEPSEDSIRGTFSDLDQSLQTVANDPENRGARSDLVGRADTFTNVLRRFNRQLQQLGGSRTGSVNEQISTTVSEVNTLANEVASLNTEISTAKSRGGNPNDLLDERDAVVGELSEFGEIDTSRKEGEFRVTMSGFTLVQGQKAHELEYGRKESGGDRKILYDNPSKSVVPPENGKLGALFEMRDEVIPGITEELNDLSVQYVDRFNDLHESGFGLDGQTGNEFFSDLPTRDSGIFRLEGIGSGGGSIENQRAGFIDSPDVALAGDPETSEPENFEDDEAVSGVDGSGDPIGNPTGQLTINNSVISYDMTEDSANDVIDRINSADNQAEAYLSSENRLVIKGSQENDYEISELNDSGLLLDKANVLGVGGSHRTATDSLDGPTGVGLTDDTGATDGAFVGDSQLDVVAADPDGGDGVDLGEGTLEFESSNSDGFQVSYDTEEDSLNDIIDRINTRANDVGSNVRAGKDASDRFQLFGFGDDGRQSLNGDASAGDDVTVDVDDVEAFDEGQRVGFFEGSSSDPGEITQVKSVDEDDGTITVDLANNYDTADGAQVTADFGGNFRVNDEASQQLGNSSTAAGTVGAGSDVDLAVKDATKFSLGDDIRISSADGSTSETAEVTDLDTGTNQITVDSLSNSYSFDEGDNTTHASVQTSPDTNENRNLLSSLGMDRRLTENQEGTEYAVEGSSQRPPVADQVASFEVSERIQNNPDLIAAAGGDDVDLDGITESTLGPGDGSNIQELSGLKSTGILENGTTSPDEKINEFITNIGSESSFVQREQSASETLVNDLQRQRQEVSGVNIDEELTRMLKHQQVFQASSRMIQTVDELTQGLMQIL